MAAKLLLELINVKLSYATLQQELEDHPDYPSLLSISDVFTKYKVDNITAYFAPEELRKVPVPFIAQIRGAESGSEFFAVVKGFTNDKVSAFDPERMRWREYGLQEFESRASGVVLLAEPGPQAGEADYRHKRREERNSSVGLYALFSLLVLVYVTAVAQAFMQAGVAAVLPVVYSLLSIAGILTGVLLIWFELDKYNPVVRNLCKGGRQVDCNAILQSGAARIWGVSWSIVGVSYFTGQLVFMLVEGIASREMQAVTGAASILALPYMCYSLYFQWRVARQWCLLCLIVQAVLVLQAAIALSGAGALIPGFPGYSSALYLVINGITLLAALLLVPELKKVKKSAYIKNQLKRLKYDPGVFEVVLQKQRNIHDGAAGLGIILGNPNAANRILKVCNPYCGPCADAHAPIEALLESNPDVQLQIIFTASNEDNDHRKWPVRHLMGIAAGNNEPLTRKALGDWYLAADKNYDHFAERYPLGDQSWPQEEKIAAMHDWCLKAGIAHTPTIFINNHELPGIYNIHDLKNFLTA